MREYFGGKIKAKLTGSSNASMYFEGTCDPDVTKADIVAHLGEGSFGHRFQSFGGGKFVYVKQTD